MVNWVRFLHNSRRKEISWTIISRSYLSLVQQDNYEAFECVFSCSSNYGKHDLRCHLQEPLNQSMISLKFQKESLLRSPIVVHITEFSVWYYLA